MCISKATPGLLLLLLLLTLAGCAGLGRESTPLEQYVLGGTPPAEDAAVSSNAAGLTLGLRQLDVAPYLASPAIVVRHGEHRITVSEFHRWAENLREGVPRALARYLRAMAPVGAVDVAPWAARAEHDYLVAVHLTRFEGAVPEGLSAAEGEARMAAVWEVLREEDGALLARGATDFREGGWTEGDYAGLVTRLDRAVQTLARDLVTCMVGLAEATAAPITCPSGNAPGAR